MSNASQTAVTATRLRVFVSSTFRDMQEEREELVKRVYPQLKHFCMQRGLFLSLIDLRWGITAEQAEAEQVIPICLHEIELCRPYFVCFLGERYGWVPPRIPPAALAEFPWLRQRPGMSLTEMEIRHGALNEPEIASAFFYLRHPDYRARRTADARDLRESDPERAARLRSLKEEIRASRGRVVDNYVSPREAATQLRLDLEELIEARLPVNPLIERKRTITWQEILGQPECPKGTPAQTFDELRLKEAAFSDSLLPLFVGRTDQMQALDDFAAGEESLLVIVAPEGGGKSTLLAHWSIRYGPSHRDVAFVVRYIGHPTANFDHVLLRAAWDLNARYGLGHTVDLAGPGLPLFLTILTEAGTHGRVVLVLDGLDHVKSDPKLELDWLTSQLPPRVKILCSVRPGALADSLRARGARVEELPPLMPDERREMILQYLALYGKSVTESQLTRLSAQQESENPLFLRTLLDELRVFGRFEELDATIDRYATMRSEPDLYDAVLARLEADFRDRSGDLVGSLCRYLLCARSGSLLEEDLQGLLGLTPLHWSELHYAVRDLLVTRANRLALRDDHLAAAAARRYLAPTEDRPKTHLRLATYFQQHPNPQRGNEVAHQLVCAREWQRLRDFLLDENAHVVYTNDELRRYWAALKGLYDPEVEYVAAVDRLAATGPLAMAELLRIASFLLDAGHPNASEAVYERIVALTLGKDDWTATTALNNLALLLDGEGRRMEAIATVQRSLAIRDEAYPRFMLGVFELKDDRCTEAEKTFGSALTKAEAASYRDEELIATIRSVMGQAQRGDAAGSASLP